MSHVDSHCGSVGEIEPPPELPEIPIIIPNYTRLNLAVALKRWPDETEANWGKRKKKLKKLIESMYKLAKRPGDAVHYHEPSYVHPEP